MDTMIRISFAGAVVTTFFAASALYASWKNEATPLELSGTEGFALVELFTSEGCSSCPSADRLLADLDAKARDERRPVYVLSFHVDYWNRLGWRDPYSQADYSARQSAYASKFGSFGVYTPQMIVNGRTEFVGSDRARAVREIDAALKKRVPVSLRITAKESAASGIEIHYTVTGLELTALLHVALVDDERVVPVSSGENGGRTLRHVNVVRAFKTVTVDRNATGTVTIERPATGRVPGRIIAYLQDPAGYEIEAAAAAEI